MKRATLSYVLLFCVVAYLAYRIQTRNTGASDEQFIGTQAPPLQVEHWVSPRPELQGKFLLIDFWATWCGPCLRGIPHLNELHAQFQDKLAIVGLSREPRAKVESMGSLSIHYYSAIDTRARLASHFEVRSIPHVVLIDPDGLVRWKGHPARLSTDKLEAFFIAHK